MSGRRPEGMILILVSGVLALLVLMAGVLVQSLRFGAAAAEAAARGGLAEIAAESGMEYAGSRLWRDPRSLADRDIPWIPANACDDWTARGTESYTASPGGILNPSYSRGESWTDQALPGAVAGAYDPGIDSILPPEWADKDGDGRFSAWTGRLRGGTGTAYFSLRVRAAGGLVCVNSGEIGSPLDDHDLDGVLNGEPDPDYAADVPANAYRDADYVGNVHLVNLLNNLGAVLALSGPHGLHVAPYAPNATPAEAVAALGSIETSHLGRRLLENRPKGGYRDLVEVRQTLAPFYPPAEVETVLAHLSTQGEIVPIRLQTHPYAFSGKLVGGSGDKTMQDPDARHEFHARIDFNDAPAAVIESALRHLSHSGPGAEPSVVTEPFVRLQAGEARTMALVLAAARPIRSWRRMLAVMAANDVWETDPLYANNQRLLKEGLVLTQFDANWVMPDYFTGRRNSLEVPRESPPTGIDGTFSHQLHKAGIGSTLNSHPIQFGNPFPQPAGKIPSRMTTEMSLSPWRSAFIVDAEGTVRTGPVPGRAASWTVSGEFSRNERSILFTGQQDFEPILGAGPNPARKTWRGGEAYDDGSHPATRIGIQTRPHFPVSRWDGVTSVTNFPSESLSDPDEYRHPRAIGWVGLSSFQWTPEDLVEGIPGLSASDITLTLPFNEDAGVDADTNASWQDNFWDPYAADRPLPPATLTLTSTCAERGAYLSPDGPQTHTGTVEALWDCGTFFGEGFFPADANGPTAGTIVCWASVWNGHDRPDPEGPVTNGTLTLYYFNPTSKRFFSVLVSSNAKTITIFFGATDKVVIAPPTGNPSETLKETGWRCIAIPFERVGDETHLSVYVDGTLCLPSPVVIGQIVPDASGRMLMKLDGGIKGRSADIVFFKKKLDPLQIAGLAAKPLYASAGRYVSPRVTFDATQLPEGAVLTGFSWDGFVPEKTGGTMTLYLSGYGTDDDKLADSPPAIWDGGESPTACFFPPIAGCRKADFTLEVATAPDPVDLADAGGAVLVEDARILRETPILEEFRIHYAAGRPRWSAFAE